MLAMFLDSLYLGFRLFVPPKKFPGGCVRFPEVQEGRMCPGCVDPLPFLPALTHLAPLSPDPPCPPRRRAPPLPSLPRPWYVRVWDSTGDIELG